MLGRLAWGNIRAGEHGVRTYLYFYGLATAMFYAFNTVDEQRDLIVGGTAFPPPFAHQMGLLTLFLACAVGLAGLLLSRQVTLSDSRQLTVLWMLGAGRTRVALLLLVEQAIAGLLGTALGLVGGLLVSQALVFVTAALLQGTVVGFHPFVSLRALVVAVAGAFLVFMIAVSGSHIILMKQGRTLRQPDEGRPPSHRSRSFWQLLLGALLLFLVSYGVFVLPGTSRAHVHLMLLLPLVVPLGLGTYLLLLGLAGVLEHRETRNRGKGRRTGTRSLVVAHVVDFWRESAGSLAFVVAGLVVALLVLAVALGAYDAHGDQLSSLASQGVMLGAFAHERERMASMSYRALFLAVVLLPVLMALLFTLVLGDIATTMPDYLVLTDLGCPRRQVLRSVEFRVVSGFLMPAVLALVEAGVLLLVGLARVSSLGLHRLSVGFAVAIVVIGLVVWYCTSFTRRHCARLLRQGLGPEILRGGVPIVLSRGQDESFQQHG